MTTYSKEDLVSFGNYMVSKQRRNLYETHPEANNISVDERLSNVHDADLANWQNLHFSETISNKNKTMDVLIVNKSKNNLPTYAKKGDAGVDLQADFSNGVDDTFFNGAAYDEERNVILIFSGGRAIIPTNLYTAIPEGYEIQIRPRSGLAIKKGVTILNTPGTIDTGFRGAWGVILINMSDDVFEIAQGDKIAQAVLNKFETINWKLVDELPQSDRGEGGFGHTDITSKL